MKRRGVREARVKVIHIPALSETSTPKEASYSSQARALTSNWQSDKLRLAHPTEMSFEPHFTHHRRTSIESKSFDDPLASASSLLAELDKIAPIKAFDAFPKVQPTYTTSSRRGGILTATLGAVIFLLVLNDLGEYLYGQPGYEFHVENEIDKTELQLNVDLTVAMPCHCKYHYPRGLLNNSD
jgi:hypothetical protein